MGLASRDVVFVFIDNPDHHRLDLTGLGTDDAACVLTCQGPVDLTINAMTAAFTHDSGTVVVVTDRPDVYAPLVDRVSLRVGFRVFVRHLPVIGKPRAYPSFLW